MPFVFFLVFLVAILTMGSILVGPFSIRIYMTALMLGSLIVFKRPNRENPCKIRRDYIRLFLLCIGMLGFALLLNGGLVLFGFLNRCLAYYLVCIVAYFAIDRYVNNEKHFDILVFVLSLIVIFDTAVTILQYQNNAIGWGIGGVFSDLEEFAGYLDDHDSFVGVSKLPGIFGHPVSNGFFLAVVSPMMLTGIRKKKNKLIALYYSFTILLTLLALFYLQQRAAFFLVVMFVAYHILQAIVKNPILFIVPIGVLLLLLLLFQSSGGGDVETGRLSTADNSTRIRVWRWAFQVISENPIIGNPVLYYKSAEYSAHNVLIDSLIDSGLFGFIPMFILYFRTVKDSFLIARKSNHLYVRAFSYSVLICMAMGMFHNTSYITGDVIIFISLALLFKAELLSKPLNQ